MPKVSESLSLKISTLPTVPGVYIFKNKVGKILYIGKAKNLRNRVRTYFQQSATHTERTARMVEKVADFELMVTENEVEALILEANLVHEHHPLYNVALKDDKHFPYIKVTTQERFPRVLIVRKLEKDGATYFGPYTSAKGMRKTVSFLTHLFKIRSCSYVLPAPEGKSVKVCLDYHIKRCGGPCESHQSEESYRASVDSLLMILAGKSRKLLKLLTDRMQTASDKEQFEEAGELRDQIEAIQSVMRKQNVDVGEVVNRDIISMAREESVVIAVVMQIREGILIGRQDFQLSADEDHSDADVLEKFVAQYYNGQPNLPRELCLPCNVPDNKLLEQMLRKLRGGAVSVVTPKKGQKMRLIDLAATNARLLLDELLIQKRNQTERTSKMVTALQEAINLKKAPRTIVCFDISNTGETDAVGSCVFFLNGKPRKKEYRHFKIKTVMGQDDFAMMAEVIGRYFKRRQEEQLDMPDLVVVDGGKGQLSTAIKVINSLNIKGLQIIGLAKRLEEIYQEGMSEPLIIPKASPALMLLKQIRDEAHRFAITYNRKVRSKRTITSALDGIKGVGPAKRRALLNTFGSVKRIKEQTPDLLSVVKGVTPELAKRILSKLKER